MDDDGYILPVLYDDGVDPRIEKIWLEAGWTHRSESRKPMRHEHRGGRCNLVFAWFPFDSSACSFREVARGERTFYLKKKASIISSCRQSLHTFVFRWDAISQHDRHNSTLKMLLSSYQAVYRFLSFAHKRRCERTE